MDKHNKIRALIEVEVDVKEYLDQCDVPGVGFTTLANNLSTWANIHKTSWITDAHTKKIKVQQKWETVWKREKNGSDN